jgi:phenylacetate-coenzyme A ligase PaaK-like adenylate-forming protein
MKFISRDDLESIQEKKVIDQVNFAYANSPFYKRKFDEVGIEPEDIKSMDDFFEKVPFSSKQELIDSQIAHPPFGEFLAVPNEKIKLIFISPGPIFEPHTEKDLQVLRDGLGKRIIDLGIGRGDICQVTLSYHLMPAGFAIHIGAEAAGCTVIPAGTGESRMQVDVMRKAGTTIYVGTPSFLARIAEKAEKMKIDPRQVGEVVERYRELGRFHILVERPGVYDEMTIFVECKEIEKFEEWEEKLKEAFKEILRIKCDVKMVHTGEIPPDVDVLEDRRGHYAE